jgi:hypothetical protein
MLKLRAAALTSLISVGFSCGDERAGSPTRVDAPAQEQGHAPRQEQAIDRAQGDGCVLTSAQGFFRDATALNFNYEPVRPSESMALASALIVRGRIVSIAPGRTLDFGGRGLAQPTSVLTVQVAKAFRPAPELSLVHVELVRGSTVPEQKLSALNTHLPNEQLTLFLVEANPQWAAAHNLDDPSPNVPAGATLYALRTPQALVLSSACELAQPLASEPFLETSSARNTAALDAAIEKALGGERWQSACSAALGSAIDVAHEPAWARYDRFAPWTDGTGCLLRVDMISDRVGPAHCSWDDTRVISLGTPVGTANAERSGGLQYVRDPNGSYGIAAFVDGFDADATLPSAARDSGFRLGDIELWFVPDDDSAIYLTGGNGVERWPRGDVPLCA